MGKQCEKCLKKYDETWGVCLLCGDKLKREEECRVVCAAEGEVASESSERRHSLEKIIYISGIVFLVLILIAVAYFAGAGVWSGIVERILAVRK